MIEFLKSIDTQLFLFLNGINSVFFDNFMFVFSYKWTWIPFYLSILYVFIRYWKKESIWLIVFLVLFIFLSDQTTSSIIKDLVQRPRPSRAEELDGLAHLVNGYRGGRFGFVSSHAANSFGFALFCSLIFRRKIYTWCFFLWAALKAYSRIYLGVHYPGDILGGVIVGVFFALFCFFLLKKTRPNISQNNLYEISFIQKQGIFLPLWTILVLILGIIAYSLIIISSA